MVVEVVVIGDYLPEFAVGVVQVDPHPIVDVHYPARIAVPGSLARYAIDVVDHHRTHDPFPPRRLGPSNRHVVAAREVCTVLSKIRESYNFALTQIVTGVE